jgi:23S rRNA pseudoU1915 N3-methylase RlmH
VVALEQLYRACTINNHHPYHHWWISWF